MKNAEIIRAVKIAARDGFAWPGGYPLLVVMADGECLCVKCARDNFALIGRHTRDEMRDGWHAAGVDIHYEGADEICAHCGDAIASAYGDPEENSRAATVARLESELKDARNAND